MDAISVDGKMPPYEVEKVFDDAIKWLYPKAEYYHDWGAFTEVFIKADQEEDDEWCYMIGNTKYRAAFTEDIRILRDKFNSKAKTNEQISLF